MSANRDISILAVDDKKNMRTLVKACLNRCGFKKVDLADDGTTALRQLYYSKYDLVLTDWNMVLMDGMELTKQIRSNPDSTIANLPIIMVTAEATRDHVVQAARFGVYEYVIKPFTPQTLESKIDRIFETA